MMRDIHSHTHKKLHQTLWLRGGPVPWETTRPSPRSLTTAAGEDGGQRHQGAPCGCHGTGTAGALEELQCGIRPDTEEAARVLLAPGDSASDVVSKTGIM